MVSGVNKLSVQSNVKFQGKKDPECQPKTQHECSQDCCNFSTKNTKNDKALKVGLVGVALGELAVIVGLHKINNATKAKLSQVVKEAAEDKLTGLKNKGSFMKAMPEIFKEAKEKGSKLTIAMFDMDYFKSVNDILGHETGDNFLKALGKCAKDLTSKHPDNFVPYRVGGEEFNVVFKNTDKNQAVEIMKEFKENFKNNKEIQGHKEEFLKKVDKKLKMGLTKVEEDKLLAWKDHVEKNGFTLSIGIAEKAEGDLVHQAIVERADKLLYQAKESGRNALVSDLIPESQMNKILSVKIKHKRKSVYSRSSDK